MNAPNATTFGCYAIAPETFFDFDRCVSARAWRFDAWHGSGGATTALLTLKGVRGAVREWRRRGYRRFTLKTGDSVRVTMGGVS